MEPNIGNFTALVNGFITDSPRRHERSFCCPMLDDILKRIKKRLDVVGLSATAASKQAGLSADGIRNIKRGVAAGRRGATITTLNALAPVLKTTVTWLMEGKGPEETSEAEPLAIPLVGHVGAGAATHLFDQGQGPFGDVKGPEISLLTVAVEIRGESLGPFFNGWLALYDQVRRPASPRFIGRVCVVGLVDGRVLIKLLAKGQRAGRWTLLSQFEPPIYDAQIEWVAAITAICPK
jgi:hypothetical protein